MGLRESYDFDTLVNEAERLVIEELEKQLENAENADTCRCEDCILDMATLALNHVKPLYRVSLLGSLYAGTLNRTENADEIHAAVRDAVAKVRKNPSH